jgi:hypothetical protein
LFDTWVFTVFGRGLKDGARLRPVSENYQGLYVLFSVLLACRRSLYPWSSEEEIEGGKGFVFRGKEKTLVSRGPRR